VYGTGDPAQTDALRKAAERGAKGWPLWLWRVRQPVVADTEVTEEQLRTHHVVLYATPGTNLIFERIAERIPVQITKDAVVLGGKRYASAGVGVKLVHPNPLAPERYVIVQGAPTTSAVAAGHNLPDFVPDWVVYDAASTRARPRLVYGTKGAPPAMGFFDARWQVPRSEEDGDDTKLLDGGVPGETHGDAGIVLPPIPRPPARPPVPTTFEAPPETQAGAAARALAELVRGFPNFRAQTPGARWIVDPLARWSVRANDRCLAALAEARVPVTEFTPLLPTPVPTPVELAGAVNGVWFRMAHAERPLVVSCELAARLPALVEVLKRHGIRGADVMSGYREAPRTSFHTFGLALDLYRFWTLDGTLGVEAHFEHTPEHRTCEAPRAKTPRARVLRDVACGLAETRRFSTVLTPNYNEGHRDHFHVDVRPDDPRVFVR
jgi:hypothetical protein